GLRRRCSGNVFANLKHGAVAAIRNVVKAFRAYREDSPIETRIQVSLGDEFARDYHVHILQDCIEGQTVDLLVSENESKSGVCWSKRVGQRFGSCGGRERDAYGFDDAQRGELRFRCCRVHSPYLSGTRRIRAGRHKETVGGVEFDKKWSIRGIKARVGA